MLPSEEIHQKGKRSFSATGMFWTVFKYASAIQGVFGCKEVGGSKEMGKYNCLLPYLSKHQKRKIRNPISSSLFSFTQSFSHFQSATVNFVVM